jgi:hypothetical protein
MKKILPNIIIKVVLVIIELVFVGVLAYMRLMNAGWMLFILGIGLIAWIVIHLVLMAVFIASLRLNLFDILLYLAVHFFYLFGWLLQSDGGDSDVVTWTIQQIYSSPALTAFLEKNGDNLLVFMGSATVLCYFIIVIYLIVRLVLFMMSRRKKEVPQGA